MISLELARQLKDAGLEWNRQKYDHFYTTGGVGKKYKLDIMSAPIYQSDIFAPTLSQLLGEIEARGWDGALWFKKDGCHFRLYGKDRYCAFDANSPEAAAAAALLWILREGKE